MSTQLITVVIITFIPRFVYGNCNNNFQTDAQVE